jgi:hypothetical protein
MTIYKFVVPGDRFYDDPIDPEMSWRSCAAVVMAETETEARARLGAYATENGLDLRWLRVARVIVIPMPQTPSVLIWVL